MTMIPTTNCTASHGGNTWVKYDHAVLSFAKAAYACNQQLWVDLINSDTATDGIVSELNVLAVLEKSKTNEMADNIVRNLKDRNSVTDDLAEMLLAGQGAVEQWHVTDPEDNFREWLEDNFKDDQVYLNAGRMLLGAGIGVVSHPRDVLLSVATDAFDSRLQVLPWLSLDTVRTTDVLQAMWLSSEPYARLTGI